MTRISSGASSYEDEVYEAASVRPYAVTGGRVRSSSSELPLETLIERLAGGPDERGLPPERRAILQHAAANFISIAEVSALLRMPLGVVRILISDLVEEGYLKVHTSMPVNVHTGHGQNPALSLSVLESVLNGISAL